MEDGTKRLTAQEEFWKGGFGDDYCDRNQSKALTASRIAFFVKALARAGSIGSAIEMGPNVGINLLSLRTLFFDISLTAVEINEKAATAARLNDPQADVLCQSFLDFLPDRQWDLAFARGVLIHINPEMLPRAYEVLYKCAARYVLVAEYYSPRPVEVEYRGHSGRLFKRDFAGEMMDAYPDLELVDYGFVYHRDPLFRQDDITWFLMRKH